MTDFNYVYHFIGKALHTFMLLPQVHTTGWAEVFPAYSYNDRPRGPYQGHQVWQQTHFLSPEAAHSWERERARRERERERKRRDFTNMRENISYEGEAKRKKKKKTCLSVCKSRYSRYNFISSIGSHSANGSNRGAKKELTPICIL